MRYRLRAADGREIAVEGDRLVEPAGTFDLTIELGDGELRPGLINGHDHLHRNHYPRLGRPPYADAYQWGRDIHARDAETIARARAVDRREALLFGALKNLLSGVTTVVHHDPWEPAFDHQFPIRVARVRSVHSLGTERERARRPPGDPALPLCIHLAEGTTPEMADEVREAHRLGLLSPRLLAVHVIGADADGVDALVRAGSALVWCPSSNDFLFGRTAPEALVQRADLLLGTDSLLTAHGTLLDELRCARSCGWVDDARLENGVGNTAALRLGLSPLALGNGAPADIALFARPLLEASAADVGLVIVGGVPRYGDPRFAELFRRLGAEVEALVVGGVEKIVSSPLGAVARKVRAQWPECGRIFD